MFSFLCILFYVLLPDLRSIIASPPQSPLLDSTTTSSTKTRTNHPCAELFAPASCFVTTYSTTTPFTWPAVGTPTKTRASKPKVTSTKDLPLAPGTSGSCGSYALHLESKSDGINRCGFIAHFYDVIVYDFISWNPSLVWDAKIVSSCVLAPGYRYCVREGTVRLNGTLSGAP